MRISDWSSDVCSSDLLEAVWLLAPLARVGAAADTVHGERERGVRFPADRAEAHRAGGETLHDLARGLHLLDRSEEHTSELQSLMRISYAVFCLKKKKINMQKQYYHVLQRQVTHVTLKHIKSVQYTT